MISKEITIVKYEQKYKESLIDLLHHIWPNINNNEVKERFEWRYERNPYVKEPFIFLAMDNDKIVGFRAFVLQLYQINGKAFKIFSPADTIVHEDYRRQGIISKLNTVSINFIDSFFLDERIFMTNLSTSKISMPAYLKQSWQPINSVKTYAYKISLKSFLFNKTDIDDSQILNRKGYRIEITSDIKSKQLELFINKNRDHNKFSNIRDESFFSWKYSHQTRKYKYLYCRKGDELLGYLIIKEESKKLYLLEEFDAIDYFVFRIMISTLINELSIPILRTWTFSGKEFSWLKKSWFFPEPFWALKLFRKDRFPILVRPTNHKPTNNDFLVDGYDIRDINNWVIYEADKH